MITVTGSLAFDHIMDFDGRFADHIMPDKIHQINLSFLVNNLSKQLGGTAGNIAYSLALLKTPVSILGSAGSDFTDYGYFLKNVGIDVSDIKIVQDKFTSSAFIMTDQADNQITGFYPGAMDENSSLVLPKSDFVVLSPNNPSAMMNFAQQCHQLNIPYLLDPGMQLPALDSEDLKKMISGATILIGNDYEISLLKEKSTLDETQLINQVKILITTLGANGSIIQTVKQKFQIQAAKAAEVLDPTGAGDAYRAGFLAGWMKKLPPQVCGQMGSVAACYAIEKYGTTNHKFKVAEFAKRYQENFGETLNL